MDENVIYEELERLFHQAKRNGFTSDLSMSFASGLLHEQLDVHIRRWRDVVINRESDDQA